MKEALSHILDQSVCLTRRQMKDYLTGTMLTEEQHAAEVHLASCPLCRMAMEGFEEHTDEALAAIASLNSGFLKEHYAAVTPQIHLNSVAPAMRAPRQKKVVAIPLWKTAAMAAGIVLAIGVFWYLNEHKSTPTASAVLADNRTTSESAAPVSAATPQSFKAGDAEMMKAAPEADEAAAASSAVRKETEQTIPPLARTLPVRESNIPVKQSPARPSAIGNTAPANTTNVSTGGGRTSGTETVVDKAADNNSTATAESAVAVPAAPVRARASAAPPVSIKKEAFKDGRSAEERADELYDNGKYKAAAKEYKNAQQDEEASRRQRARAGIQAARAYVAAGQKGKAISVLNAIIAEGGPQKRAAKKLLRQLQEQ